MFPLLAQAANKEPDREILLLLGSVFAGILLLIYLIKAFLLVSLSRTLGLCDPRERTMEPGQVWLCMVPIFDLAWHFITVSRVSESLRREFRCRRLPYRGNDFGRALGIVTFMLPLLIWCGILGIIALMACSTCGIVYWVNIVSYCRELEDDYEDYDDEYDDDYEDDRRQRNKDYDRRRRDDDDDYDRRRKDYDDDDRRFR